MPQTSTIELRQIRKLYPPAVVINLHSELSTCGALTTNPSALFGFSNLAHLSLTTTKGFGAQSYKMSDTELFVDLKAPNGREYKQPLGLFINNEFCKSSSGEKITSINPT